MEAMPVGHALHAATLDGRELRPHAADAPAYTGEDAPFGSWAVGPDGRSPAFSRRPVAMVQDELTETLTWGWAMALAGAVALVMYVSGA
jgi:hypothetical protein